jgi:hypothetical protein
MHEEYKSSISQAAIEKITGIHENGQKRSAEYWLDGEIVGVRFFHESGEPEYEYALYVRCNCF